MPWTFSTDVHEYVTAAWPVLSAEPERNTIGLTVVDNARQLVKPREQPEYFGWWVNNRGEVTGCVSITSPWPLLFLTVPEESLVPLVEALSENGIKARGVNGPTGVAATFGAVWRAATGQRVIMQDAMRLFGLAELRQTSRTPTGSARLADDDDVPLLVEWYLAFGNEVHHPMSDVADDVRHRLRTGAVWLWCNESGDAVSMAARTSPAAGVARIGPVYTPPEQRRQGYGEALTHVATADLVQRGLRVVLFTDQSNPTSNAIYQRLGYRPITDRILLMFEDG